MMVGIWNTLYVKEHITVWLAVRNISLTVENISRMVKEIALTMKNNTDGERCLNDGVIFLLIVKNISLK